MTITLDEVTKAYTKTREEISALNKKIDELKAIQARREDWMVNYLTTNHLKNAKTEFGTVYTLKKESVSVFDWDMFYTWVKENGQEDLIAHSAAKKAVLEYMGEDRTTIVPGLNYTAIRGVGIRKS